MNSKLRFRESLMVVVVICVMAVVPGPPLHAISEKDLEGIIVKLWASSDLDFKKCDTEVSRSASRGYASIQWNNDGYIKIAVDPEKLKRKSANTWAFIIGHELAHYNLNHQDGCRPPNSENCKYREFNADDLGAKLAERAKYDLVDYISDVLNEPDLCSFSHGCWHERALRLARQNDIRIVYQGQHECGVR